MIGLELGSVWKRLGADVRILEAMPTFLPFCRFCSEQRSPEGALSSRASIWNSAFIDSIKNDGDRVIVQYKDKDGKNSEMWVDRLIISIGRVPFTAPWMRQSSVLSSTKEVLLKLMQKTARTFLGVGDR